MIYERLSGLRAERVTEGENRNAQTGLRAAAGAPEDEADRPPAAEGALAPTPSQFSFARQLILGHHRPSLTRELTFVSTHTSPT